MTKPIISGIQQMGIGIPDVYEAWKWYRKAFSMDTPIFDEAATAGLMLPYTGGKPQDRHAVLAINGNGGGGFEIWQYVSRVPVAAAFEIRLGDLGIFAAKMKSRDVAKTYAEHKAKGFQTSPLYEGSNGEKTFWVKDPYGNNFQVVPSSNWFRNAHTGTGGAYGAIIGVSDMKKSMEFYRDLLGYDTVIFDGKGKFPDFAHLPGGTENFHRVILKHSRPRAGAFSRLLGESTLELVQALDSTPRKIFENRFWGDLGFIHLCFDINGMAEMKSLCEAKGHPFTVDSANSFDMGEAAGHFTYIEDPDGALIEFVETHKIPILKKLGWYLDLRKRPADKPLPDWMIRALGLNKVRD